MVLIVLVFLFGLLNCKSTCAQITESLLTCDEQYLSAFEHLPQELFTVIMHEIMQSQQYYHLALADQKNRATDMLSLMSTNRFMKERVLAEGIIEFLSQFHTDRFKKRQELVELPFTGLVREFKNTVLHSQSHVGLIQRTFNKIRDESRSLTMRYPNSINICIMLPIKIIATFCITAAIIGLLKSIGDEYICQSGGLISIILVVTFRVLCSSVDDFFDPLGKYNVFAD